MVDRSELETFLGEASARLGVDKITARDYEFKTKLFKQFIADAFLPKPEADGKKVLINLQNGTFEINGQNLANRDFDRADFLTYQLHFDYDAAADCPKWKACLSEVLPDQQRQRF